MLTNQGTHMTTNIIEVLNNAGIDLRNHSPSRAVQSFLAKQLDLDATNRFVATIAPSVAPFADLQLAHLSAGYLIEDTLKTGRTVVYGTDEESAASIRDMIERAMKLQSTTYNSSMYGESPVHVMDDDGNIVRVDRTTTTTAAPKRGKGAASAQHKAKELFDANPTLSRADMLQKMVAELGISANTASTYFASFNKDAKRATGGRKGKGAGTTVSREDQVREVFASRETWANRKELVEAIVAATGCSPASANTFSYKVMSSDRGATKREPKVIKAEKTKKSSAEVLGAIGKKTKK